MVLRNTHVWYMVCFCVNNAKMCEYKQKCKNVYNAKMCEYKQKCTCGANLVAKGLQDVSNYGLLGKIKCECLSVGLLCCKLLYLVDVICHNGLRNWYMQYGLLLMCFDVVITRYFTIYISLD